MTKEQCEAINTLEKLAKIWPLGISLFSASGTLLVVANDGEILADINIPNDGGCPYVELMGDKEYIVSGSFCND